jgi:ribonuclease T2
MRFRLVVVVAALLAVCWPVCGALARDSNDLGPQPPGQFDFYVLSLTWVPGFCAGHRDPEECSQDLGFRLHGLWPESLNGYPYDCSNEALPADVRAEYVGLCDFCAASCQTRNLRNPETSSAQR